MQKCVFDKNTVDEQLVLLSNILEDQREIKKTLLSYLEKVSDYISNTTNTENSEAIVSCLSNVQEIFDNIKSNIDKLIELKLFIENISKSTSLNIIDFEKYYNQFIELSEKIETTNNSYNNFMDKLTSIPAIDFSDLNYKKFENLNNLKIEELENTDKKIETTAEEVTEEAAQNIVTETEPSTDEVVEETVQNVLTETETSAEKVVEEATQNVVTETETSAEEVVEEAAQNVVTETETSTEEVIEETVQNVVTETTTSAEEAVEEAAQNVVTETETSTEKVVEETVPNAITETETPTEEVIEDNSSKIKFSEKTLFIDNEAHIAILPYSLLDLEEYFSENPEKYSSISDIIEKEYIVSLDDYENTSIARFKQAFKLAKEKSHLSFFESLNYANKLLFENQVEPIVIASCDNIDELEVYLECLDNDILNKFNCFTIINKYKS